MNKSRAKKWALRLGFRIIRDAVKFGWTPNTGLTIGFSPEDKYRIIDAMDEVLAELYRRSGPLNIEEETKWAELTQNGFPWKESR